MQPDFRTFKSFSDTGFRQFFQIRILLEFTRASRFALNASREFYIFG